MSVGFSLPPSFSGIYPLQSGKRKLHHCMDAKQRALTVLFAVMLLKMSMFSSWTDYGFLQNPVTRTLDSHCHSTALKPRS